MSASQEMATCGDVHILVVAIGEVKPKPKLASTFPPVDQSGCTARADTMPSISAALTGLASRFTAIPQIAIFLSVPYFHRGVRRRLTLRSLPQRHTGFGLHGHFQPALRCNSSLSKHTQARGDGDQLIHQVEVLPVNEHVRHEIHN